MTPRPARPVQHRRRPIVFVNMSMFYTNDQYPYEHAYDYEGFDLSASQMPIRPQSFAASVFRIARIFRAVAFVAGYVFIFAFGILLVPAIAMVDASLFCLERCTSVRGNRAVGFAWLISLPFIALMYYRVGLVVAALLVRKAFSLNNSFVVVVDYDSPTLEQFSVVLKSLFAVLSVLVVLVFRICIFLIFSPYLVAFFSLCACYVLYDSGSPAVYGSDA